jgi:signal transduction histidine kinase
MTPGQRSVLRALVILAGAVLMVASLLAFRAADLPIYLVFLLVSIVLFQPYVEVVPTLAIPIPEMAATIAFLYIGGLPIIVLYNVTPILTRLLRRVLPERWKERIPQLRSTVRAAGRELFSLDHATGAGIGAEWAALALGLGIRWWIVSWLVPNALPPTNPGAILVAEVGGYACWSLLYSLPIYPDRQLVALPSEGKLRAALSDIALIVVAALTPLVFLITYEYSAHGLLGASLWSLSALGLHFMLKRLNSRRLMVEEQNRRLESLNRELEHRERLSAIGKMSSVVSHQILQQLGVIGIYADLIRNADNDGDPAALLTQARTNAEAIEGALGDVNRVLRDLLVFSKDLRLNLYEHPLARVIEECVEDCRSEAEERGARLRAECPDDINLALDKLKIKQAITNVLRNALQVSQPGGEVTVRAAVRDGRVEIAIADQGPGIPERDQEAVFTPFFTTKEHGTGLGLAIARQFVEAHGGQVRVESPAGVPGATFVFSLPVKRG